MDGTSTGDAIRALPPHISLLALAAALFLLGILIRKTKGDGWLRFLGLLIWMRYFAAEFPRITFTSIGGFSVVSLLSLGTIAIGTWLVLPRRDLVLNNKVMVVYLLITVTLMSGFINGQIGGAINTSLKWLYFLVITMVTLRALRNVGPRRVLEVLTLATLPPVIIQFICIPFGFAKAAEADGSASWIGGYYHEASFSMIAITLIFIASMRIVYRMGFGWSLLLLGIASLILANYRTTILGALPLIFILVSAVLVSRIRKDQRILLPLVIALFTLSLTLGAMFFQERFEDLTTSLARLPYLFVPPDQYTLEDRRLMSARPFIWSSYITQFGDADWVRSLVGFGPDAWKDFFLVYAHNTLVGALFEIGYIGVFLTLAMLLSLALTSTRASNKLLRNTLIAGHAGFFLVNMSTMPFWNLEGLIWYGVIVALSLHARRAGNEHNLISSPVNSTTRPPPLGRGARSFGEIAQRLR